MHDHPIPFKHIDHPFVSTLKRIAGSFAVEKSNICCRFQLLRALKQIENGDLMLVYQKPESKNHFSDEQERLQWFDQLKNLDSWQHSSDKLIPYIVPGTYHDRLVGKLLIQYQWCEPLRLHWVPNVMIYRISKKGRHALSGGRDWWRDQTIFQKLTLMLLE